jgi:methylenetetrahydrofolate reductase (NADPH)
VETAKDKAFGPAASRSDLARLLATVRFEIVPVPRMEHAIGELARGSTVAVTASPRYGLERTLAISEHLAARGYRVVPHLAAHMIQGRAHLETIAGRLKAADIADAFVVGGDADARPGSYSDASALLEALADLPWQPPRIGIAGHPEGHPHASNAQLLDALRRKAPLAHCIVTQMCFDAEGIVRWIDSVRNAGVRPPILIGLPGPVERRRLVELAWRTGVGVSLRYLRAHRGFADVALNRRYDPSPLARAIAAHLDDPGVLVGGVHLFTFNRLAATQAWVRAAARR